MPKHPREVDGYVMVCPNCGKPSRIVVVDGEKHYQGGCGCEGGAVYVRETILSANARQECTRLIVEAQ
jgi:hypothetical protein